MRSSAAKSSKSDTAPRVLLVAMLSLALSACGGASSGLGLGGSNAAPCYAGTQVQLASPGPNQGGVPTTIGQLIVVANGNNNNLQRVRRVPNFAEQQF